VPSRISTLFNSIGGSLMVRSGRVGLLGTTGAKTGLARTAPIGFVTRPDGSLLIGSGSKVNRGWTANLKANPEATFSIKGEERRYRATLVGPEGREAALAELKSSMGRVAERADWGDLFVLEPVA
jgi:deazaflavin-dependent oxidoreductase (nitroreductase family)